jgi:hypothetical protein
MDPLDDQVLHRLGDGLLTGLEWTAKAVLNETGDSAPGHYARLLVSGLNGLRILEPPAYREQPSLPFHAPHRIRADLFNVLGGGMRGGTTIDILLQIWLRTESLSCGYAIPLIFRLVPSHGPIPAVVWEEMRQVARALLPTTPSALFVLIPDAGPFELERGGLRSQHAFTALPALHVAGLRKPARGVEGRLPMFFVHDIAAGWGADPALSGMTPSPVLDEFLHAFAIDHLVRLIVEPVPAPDAKKPGAPSA